MNIKDLYGILVYIIYDACPHIIIKIYNSYFIIVVQLYFTYFTKFDKIFLFKLLIELSWSNRNISKANISLN